MLILLIAYAVIGLVIFGALLMIADAVPIGPINIWSALVSFGLACVWPLWLGGILLWFLFRAVVKSDIGEY